MSMLTEIAARLIAEGVCTAVGTDLFIMSNPSTPDLCTSIWQYAGTAPMNTFDGAWDDRPGLQVRTRAAVGDIGAGEARALAAQEALKDICNETLSGTFWLSCLPLGSFASIGEDDDHRPEWTQNFKVVRDAP
jgi:hypothetical protein